MEFWPADFRPDASTSSKNKRKRKEISKLNGQSIEPGSLGAATLILEEALPQWIMAVQPISKYIPRLIGKPVEVFPPTKPPPISIPKLTIQQRAEQGARFLRTYHPDADVPFDLLKHELQLGEKQAALDSMLDPYAGNQLVSFSMESKRKQLTPFIAFTCGVTGSELNVSPFPLIKDNRFIFSPSATPTLAFDTPIHQLVSFSSREGTPQKFSLLGVRTHAVISLLKVRSRPSFDVGEPPVVAETVIPISVSETGSRRVVDMSSGSLFSSNPQILFVNDMGVVYNCQIEGAGKAISSPIDMSVNEDRLDRFWRLAWKDERSCMRASSQRVHLFDLRTQATQPQELLCLKDHWEYITSLEASSDSRHTMCFATTSRMLWYDDRNPKRPILSVMHQRSFDRSLRVESIKVGSSTLTTLSSAANNLVTVYDINFTSSGHFEMCGGPSLLPGPSVLDLPVAGSLFFQPTDNEDQVCYHFQLSSRGSLWKTNFNFSSEATVDCLDDIPGDFEWGDEMHLLAQKGKAMTQDTGNLGAREHIIADLRRVYEKMYDVQRGATDVSEEDPEAVYQTLEKMPFFWQDMGAGTTDHMLTTFDVAFQSGSEPVHASRADFLTESLLSTARGFLALMRERIPIPRLVFTASWSHDMGYLPSALVPNMLTPPQTLFNTLRKEALGQATTPQGMQRATEATQSLVLDLALSRHVYAPHSFSKTCAGTSKEVDGADMLSRATQALSLEATEPPPLQFGFLRPLARVTHRDDEHVESEGDVNSNESLEIPWGIRLLLSHWDVGSNPDDYAYKDPYVEKHASLPGEIPLTDRNKTHDMVGSTQQASIPAIVTVPRPPVVLSQGNVWLDSDTQDLPGPSTQPLPGPFGGGSRQLGTRNKVGRKRMGGF